MQNAALLAKVVFHRNREKPSLEWGVLIPDRAPDSESAGRPDLILDCAPDSESGEFLDREQHL